MSDLHQQRIMEIRRFNQFYTNIIGLVNQKILESSYSLAEVRVLLEIDNAAKCTASHLRGILQIDSGYLSRILRRLKKEGLIETKKSITDGRSRILSITAKGRETYQCLSETSSSQITGLIEHLPQGARQQLVNHMVAIRNMLSARSENLITIRERHPGDVGYIAYRHGVLYTQEYGLDQIFEKYVLQSLITYLENPSAGKVFVAEYCGAIIGFMGIVEISKKLAQLRWFLIEPEFRGSGLGRKLLSTAMRYCQQQHYHNVFLWTFKGLDAARHLYEEWGFTLTEEKENNTWRGSLIEQRWDLFLKEA